MVIILRNIITDKATGMQLNSTIHLLIYWFYAWTLINSQAMRVAVKKGLTLTPRSVPCGGSNGTSSLQRRGESFRCIHHPSISRWFCLPDSQRTFWDPGDETNQSPSPRSWKRIGEFHEADPAVTLRLLRDFITGEAETVEARRLRRTGSRPLNGKCTETWWFQCVGA